MKHLKFLMTIIAVSFIFFTGCKKELKSGSMVAPDELQSKDASVAKQSTRLSAASKTKLNKLQSSLPAGNKALERSSGLLLKMHPEFGDMVRRAMDIEPPCDANTAMNQWLDQQLADWDADIFNYVLNTAMLDLPTYNALLFENSPANQYFGVRGEYTQRITKTFKDLKRFWNIQSNDIVLAAMHGSMLRDRDKLVRTYVFVYGLSDEDAQFYADFVLELLHDVPQYRNGDHPVFTFNSFAQESFNFPPVGVIPPKIIMGDGIMEAFTAIGFNDVAPQAILAHEFGHQIQFQLGVFGNENTPEATRRTELMADAYAAYYLSHARGASMQWKRVKQFLQVFFNIGDCAFTSTGHHGTPTQRMASAEWAYNVANNAQKQGHILTSQQFTALFEAQLPEILMH